MSYLVKVNFKLGRGFSPVKIGDVLTQEQVNVLGNAKVQELLKVGFLESVLGGGSNVSAQPVVEQVSEVSEPMPEIDEYNDEPKKKKRK